LGSDWHDNHFFVETDDDGHSHVRFGDGDAGRKPDAGSVFRAAYRTGCGKAGNVGAGAIAHLVMREVVRDGVRLRPSNPMHARGGTDPETVDEARLRVPYAFRRDLRRAIIADDYARLAERDFPLKVQRAACDLLWTGSWYEARVAVDQRGKTEADQDLVDRVRDRLGLYRRIGHDLDARRAMTVPLDMTLRVCVSPGYPPGDVSAALLERFGNRLLADGRPEFFHPDNLTFGEAVSLSRIIAEAGTVPGVENAVIEKFGRAGGPSDEAVRTGVLLLGPFEIARLDNDPANPGNGVLTLVIQEER
jgi:predicted phage baseplate assembly protein